MRSSELINELANALCNAQKKMGSAVKDSPNTFFKSKYADLGSVIEVIKQPFADNGLSYTQFPISTEHGVGVVTRLMHLSGQYLEMEYTLPTVKKDPQASGSAITYARRYALQSIAGIPTEDDDAESAMLRGDDKKKVSQDQVITIKKLIDETKVDQDAFLKWVKVKDIGDIQVNIYDRVIAALEAKK
jgi:hypothetical protein